MEEVLAINPQVSMCKDETGQLQLALNIENATNILELLRKTQEHPKFLDPSSGKDSDYSSASSISSDDDGE